MLKPIEVFKAGKHRALNGKTYEFSAADVAQIASSYDPKVLAAPYVLGHPKTNDPAWAWAESLSVNDDGVLVASPEKVNADFAAGVESGAYRYVSASLYAPEDPANPKPGGWYLRHVGFLGATPPSVKGLAPAFSEDPADLVEFATADGYSVKELFRGLRDWIIADKGLDVADKVLPSWYIDSVVTDPAPVSYAEGEESVSGAESAAGGDTLDAGAGADTISGDANLGAQFAEREATLLERENALVAREAEADARAADFAERARTAARTEDGSLLDELVTAGRLPPGHRNRVEVILARLGGDDTLDFAEAGADPRAEFRELLATLGTSIAFSEFSGGNGFDPASAEAAPQIAAEITRLVGEAAARGEHISYSQAALQLGR